MMRLDRYLAEAGTGSRSDVKKLIARSRVSVNDEICRDPARKVDEASDVVCCDGRRIVYEQFVYFMLNKPQGVISESRRTRLEVKSSGARDADGISSPDSDGEPGNAGDAKYMGDAGIARVRTCIDLIREETHRDLFPVGRLDKDTEGLLLITDDGQLAHELLSPKKHVDKVYYVELEKPLSDVDRVKVEKGIDIGDDTPTLPARICMLSDSMSAADSVEMVSHSSTVASRMTLKGTLSPGCALEITIHEGRFHQIKRMFDAVGNKVTFLKRLRMGSLKLDDSLAPGEYRRLTPEELAAVRP